MKDEKEAKLENAIQPKSNINITRVIIGLILCSILFIIHSISMVFLLWLVDNIIYYGEIKQKIFGLFAIFFGPIISFFVCSYVYFLFLHKKSIYVFMLIVPIFVFFTMKITKNKIIDYFNIPEDLGIAEIIDITIAILLYIITKIIIEKFIIKDKK